MTTAVQPTDEWSTALDQSLQNLFTNWAGGGSSYFDQYGNIDVTAPGGGETYSATDLAEATRGLIDPTLQAAQDIYNAGRPDLNPLLQEYYDAAGTDLVAQATGSDPYTQQLAQNAASIAASPFGAAGTFGSARANQAAANAATQAMLDRQDAARRELGQVGQNYQDWQTGADWDWLSKFQGAVASTPQGATYGENIDRLSGADILTAQVNRDILAQNLGTALGQGGSQLSSGEWYSPIINQVGGQVIGDLAGGLTDVVGDAIGSIGDWF